jgi:hypothetical protein
MTSPSVKPDEVVRTIDRLTKRIEERFHGAGLANVCRDLGGVAKQAHERSRWIARPIWLLRIAAALLITALIAASMIALWNIRGPKGEMDRTEFIQVLEAGINDVVLIGAAIFFLVTLEKRIKRRRALAAIHELRCLAHIVDMHQLTKDPDRVLLRGERTASSPKEEMTAFALSRYLDYCTEMLSLIGKVASVYVQNFDDPVALGSANEVESMATGLSRKIWQKIMLLHSLEDWNQPAATKRQAP